MSILPPQPTPFRRVPATDHRATSWFTTPDPRLPAEHRSRKELPLFLATLALLGILAFLLMRPGSSGKGSATTANAAGPQVSQPVAIPKPSAAVLQPAETQKASKR